MDPSLQIIEEFVRQNRLLGRKKSLDILEEKSVKDDLNLSQIMSVTPAMYSPKIIVSNVNDKNKILSERSMNKTHVEIDKHYQHLEMYSQGSMTYENNSQGTAE